MINHLNAELNPSYYLLALLGAHHILHVSRIRAKSKTQCLIMTFCGDLHCHHNLLATLALGLAGEKFYFVPVHKG